LSYRPLTCETVLQFIITNSIPPLHSKQTEREKKKRRKKRGRERRREKKKKKKTDIYREPIYLAL
jgi:hypothetical protein